MKQKTLLSCLILLLIVLNACEQTGTPKTPTTSTDNDSVETYTVKETVTITYNGEMATVTNSASTGVNVVINGAHVTVNSTIEGLSINTTGSTTNGNLKIYSSHKFKLLLNGVNIANTSGSAINIQSSKRVFLVLQDSTTNALTDGSTYPISTTEDEKACLFSEGQLIFSGNGSLTLEGNYKHAICSDDYVRVRSGNITVTKSMSDALHTKDYFICDGGTLTLTTTGTGGDAIDVDKGYIEINEGSININSVDKGITASFDPLTTVTTDSITPYITINGGTIIINTNGEKAHGINTTNNVTMNNGSVTINAAGTKSDGINVNGTITLNGGHLTITAADDCTNVVPIDNANVLTCN